MTVDAVAAAIYLSVPVLGFAVTLNIISIVRLHRATDRLTAAREAYEEAARELPEIPEEVVLPAMQDEIVLPTIVLNEHGQIVELGFDLGTIESGASKTIAIPIIKGLGQAILSVGAAGGATEQRYFFDFETGTVGPVPPGVSSTDLPPAFTRWRDAEDGSKQ